MTEAQAAPHRTHAGTRTLPLRVQALLPEISQDLLMILGDSDGFALLRHAPGKKLYIPLHPSDAHELSHVLSAHGFAKLCATYGSRDLTMPVLRRVKNALRNAAILADYAGDRAQGVRPLTPNQLVDKYTLCHRMIERILNQAAALDDDSDLKSVVQAALF
jgi:hypothetical protein